MFIVADDWLKLERVYSKHDARWNWPKRTGGGGICL